MTRTALFAVCATLVALGSMAAAASGGTDETEAVPTPSEAAPEDGAGGTGDADPDEAPPVDFTEAFLADEGHVSAGQVIWEEQCRHCHGASAYPGKAPKLRPRRYTPDFVYDRVSNGFRKMPAWRDVYSELERMQVVAYILSRSFSP